MSSVPPNIERFNLTALRVFERLYDEFPGEADLETAMLGAEAAPEDLDVGYSLNYALFADEVVHWLAEEGFIRISGHQSGTAITGVRLTLKGLTILGYLPSSLQGKEVSEPIITKIKRVLSSGAEKASAEAVKSVLSGVFRLAISSALEPGAGGGVSA